MKKEIKNKKRVFGLSSSINKSLPKSLLELNKKQIESLKTVTSVVLLVVGVLGITTVSVVAPNALRLIKTFGWAKRKFANSYDAKELRRKALKKSFYYLKAKGYLELKQNKGILTAFLTQKGKLKVEDLNFKTLSVPKQLKWDRCWWFVMADIPTEDFKHQADTFRKKIKVMGFYPLQRSVWVYCYDPRAQIQWLCSYYGIDKFVTILKAVQIEEQDESRLQKFFFYK